MNMKTEDPKNEIYLLAAEFSAIIKTWLTPAEMSEVLSLNESEEDKSICHSHDFCDANMAMHEVFMRHGMDVTSEHGVSNFGEKWGAAWQLAIENRFWM